MTRNVLSKAIPYLTLLLLAASSATAGQVTYQSTHATASGYSDSRSYGEQFFDNQSATLRITYLYDPAIVGVVQGDTTTFAVPTLSISIYVPGYFTTAAGPGTVSWTGDTIRFHGEFVPFLNNPPADVIDATFAAGLLTAGLLPSSLAGLEGIVGNFVANSQATIFFHGDTGFVTGSAVSAPEPSSAVLFGLGIAVIILAYRRRRR